MIDKLRAIIKDFPAYVKRYLWPLPKFRREIVVMVDGVHSHGGLTDRFRNILSIYDYCKEHDIPFRLYYVYPCDLQHFFLPNIYDWTIKPSEISHSYYDSKELILYVRPIEGVNLDEMIRINNEEHLDLLNKELGMGKKVQYHLYGNTCLAAGYYQELWNELFKMTPFLETHINQVRQNFKEPYESVTLRFQQLLGDFDEGKFEILSEDARDVLIQTCFDKIDELYHTGYFSTHKVLITSDSQTFLKRVKELPYVYTIPGKLEHMDFTQNDNLEVNVKPFIDLILLSESQRLTLLTVGKMYKSGFPAFAAELGGKHYNELLYHL